ncbi:MAG: hypothetical protein KA974_00115 [Saprospiraceae bacterium]|nr:hypothetical protein [Saprospiraceae bacterium]MBP7680018.1 hypothetical protein [Saprospiraceae bacterium]
MHTITKLLLLLLGLLVIAYFFGEHPPMPTFATAIASVPSELVLLENNIRESEKKVEGIKPNNEARIVWADSTKKVKTPVAILYLHGFSASQEEGAPVHTNIAKRFACNLYLARLEEHGIDRKTTNDNMLYLTADNYQASAERAYQIAKQLGDSVIVIGTSAGGAHTLFLAARHPEIKAIVLYSPCIEIAALGASLLDNNWGLQLARLMKSSEYNDIHPNNTFHQQYWTLHYRLEATVALQNFLTNAITPATFAKVKCPAYMAYYYKDEARQDDIVSVAAMLQMFDQLGTPPAIRRKEAFPNSANHVIASYVLSKDWQSVQQGTEKFLTEIVGLP